VAIVQVAVTQRGLDALARRIWLRSVWPQAALLAAVALLGWFWVRVALRPVTRISAQVRNRELESSAPIAADDAPQELRPLVQAINDYIERIGQYVGERGRFISNAAHQLKTPITVLNTQITVGLRSEGPEPKQQALAGSYQTVQHCIRLIHQLLTLSSAEHTLVPRIEPTVVPLGDVVREVLEDFAERAHGKNIDLGLGAETEDAQVRGVPLMLRELVANLVDNALRYTPEEGTVTVSVLRRDGEVWLEVEDSGPGIPAAERERVFERFYRLADTAHEEGSGLGLAIVREIAMASGARIELQDRADGSPGLLVRVVFP
jgi:two-component system sensor histidine kinase TctE